MAQSQFLAELHLKETLGITNKTTTEEYNQKGQILIELP